MSLKDRIIHESMRLFSIKGFNGTSINDILEATGASKGGFYNHFDSKDALFYEVLRASQKIWRQHTLYGIKELDSPLAKIKQILWNYKERYLVDIEDFPGGCIFATLSIELDNMNSELAGEMNDGFTSFKGFLAQLIDEAKAQNELNSSIDTVTLADMLFASLFGVSVHYGINDSLDSLGQSLNLLIQLLDNFHPDS